MASSADLYIPVVMRVYFFRPPALSLPVILARLFNCARQIVSADTPIFLRLIADLFPSMDLAPKV